MDCHATRVENHDRAGVMGYPRPGCKQTTKKEGTSPPIAREQSKWQTASREEISMERTLTWSL
eukprot:1186685-Amphidinium_carterae.2